MIEGDDGEAIAPGASLPLIIGVTAHRNLLGDEVEGARALARDFLLRLRGEFPQLSLTVLSALAAGGDQLVAEEALALGIRLVAPLPLPREVYARDFTDAVSRARFDALCSRALVLEPAQADDATPAWVREGEPSHDWQYAQSGIYLASHCHVLLALWDGKPSALPGGTAQVVDYYLGGRKPALVERRRGEDAASCLDNDDLRLAFHIVCSRADANGDGAPAPPLRPLEVCWRTGAGILPGEQPMPARFRATFLRMAEFGADVARHAGRIRAATVPHPGKDAPSPIERAFAAADTLALHYQHRVLAAMRAMYTLAALMGIAFVLYDGLAQDYMIFLFLVLFASGVTLDVVARRRDWHRKYLDYRALAEGLRVQGYWHRAGLSMTGDAEFAHDNFLQKQDVDLGWIRDVMRAVALEAAAMPRSQDDLAALIAEWVGESGRSGQLHYYERRLAERTRRHALTHAVGAVSLWLGIAISVFLALAVFRLPRGAQNVLVAIMAVLSIVAAVREAYAYRKADKELIKQYRFMRRLFANARCALDRCGDPAGQRRILRALGEAALAEHAEWALMHRERPLERARL